MQLKGIKRGKTIELFEDIDIADGTEVQVEIELLPLSDRQQSDANWDNEKESDSERMRKLHALLDNWEGREELVAVLMELDRERHADPEPEPLAG